MTDYDDFLRARVALGREQVANGEVASAAEVEARAAAGGRLDGDLVLAAVEHVAVEGHVDRHAVRLAAHAVVVDVLEDLVADRGGL